MIFLALIGCASAPDLPPVAAPTAADFGPVDQKMSCAEIKTEQQSVAESIHALDSIVNGSHEGNQTAFYAAQTASPLFLLAVKFHNDERAKLAQLAQRRDVLFRLARFHGCKDGWVPKAVPP